MHILIFSLRLSVTRHRSTNIAHSTLHATRDALPEVRQLALGLLRLAVRVLLDAALAQVLVANEVADGLLGGADGLVPRARGAVLVVGDGGAAVGVGCEGA